MEKFNLREIKRGETGHGILVENDGYIYLSEEDGKKLNEGIDSDNGEICPHPFIVSAVFQKFDIENANGRIYPERVLKREVENFQQKIKDRRAIGELNHPAESIVDLERASMNIVELHWVGNTLVGKLEVVTTPGFRKYGICSSAGDRAANLLLENIKVGVSSRGLGSVENKFGKMIVGDDFELVCWDFVSDPSTPNAWVEKDEMNLKPYIESKDNSGKGQINEKLDKFKGWLNIKD